LGVNTDRSFREAFSKADINLELTFAKPIPKVNLTMYSPGNYRPFLDLNFRRHSKGRVQTPSSDRSDTTIIGFETIRAVAELLFPAD
jgi:hypothetical protein